MIEVLADKCAKSTLLNGPFGGDDRAFDRLLGPAGILTRTSLVTATMDGRVTYYGPDRGGKSLPADLGYRAELSRSLYRGRSLEEIVTGLEPTKLDATLLLARKKDGFGSLIL